MVTGPTATIVAGSSRVYASDFNATPRRHLTLAITGMTYASGTGTGQNAIPHGLPFTPIRISFRPSGLGLWGEIQTPDSTAIYIQVGSGGALGGQIDVEE